MEMNTGIGHNLSGHPWQQNKEAGCLLDSPPHPMFGVEEERLYNKVVGFLWGLHFYKKREMYCVSQNNMSPHPDCINSGPLRIKSKIRIGTQEISGRKLQ